MFAKLMGWLGWAGKAAVVVLALVGVLSIWLVSGFIDYMNGAKPKVSAVMAAPVVAVVPKPAALVSAAVLDDCPCAAEKVCEGPQGGHYCMTDGGKKRYMKSQP